MKIKNLLIIFSLLFQQMQLSAVATVNKIQTLKEIKNEQQSKIRRAIEFIKRHKIEFAIGSVITAALIGAGVYGVVQYRKNQDQDNKETNPVSKKVEKELKKAQKVSNLKKELLRQGFDVKSEKEDHDMLADVTKDFLINKITGFLNPAFTMSKEEIDGFVVIKTDTKDKSKGGLKHAFFIPEKIYIEKAIGIDPLRKLALDEDFQKQMKNANFQFQDVGVFPSYLSWSDIPLNILKNREEPAILKSKEDLKYRVFKDVAGDLTIVPDDIYQEALKDYNKKIK